MPFGTARVRAGRRDLLSQDQMSVLAKHCCGIASELGACQQIVEKDAAPKPSRIALAKWILGQHLWRTRLPGLEDLGEHALNMLLDLYVSAAEKRVLDVTGLVVGSGAAATTALRWIRVLEKRQLLTRTADSTDGRRWFVDLTPAGADLMERYFDAVRNPDGSPVARTVSPAG